MTDGVRAQRRVGTGLALKQRAHLEPGHARGHGPSYVVGRRPLLRAADTGLGTVTLRPYPKAVIFATPA